MNLMNNKKLQAGLAYALILCFVSSAVALNKMSERRLDSVHPVLEQQFRKVTRDLSEKFPEYKVEVMSGYRSKEEQDKLFNQGKTPARGGYSYHNYALALDAAPFRNGKPVFDDMNFWREYTRTVQKYGMEAGGAWRKRDYPHAQIPSGLYPIRKLKKDTEKYGLGNVLINAGELMANAMKKRNTATFAPKDSPKRAKKKSDCCCDCTR